MTDGQYHSVHTPFRCGKWCCTEAVKGYRLQDKFVAPWVGATPREYTSVGPFCPVCKPQYFGEAAMKKLVVYTGANGLKMWSGARRACACVHLERVCVMQQLVPLQGRWGLHPRLHEVHPQAGAGGFCLLGCGGPDRPGMP